MTFNVCELEAMASESLEFSIIHSMVDLSSSFFVNFGPRLQTCSRCIKIRWVDCFFWGGKPTTVIADIATIIPAESNKAQKPIIAVFCYWHLASGCTWHRSHTQCVRWDCPGCKWLRDVPTRAKRPDLSKQTKIRKGKGANPRMSLHHLALHIP